MSSEGKFGPDELLISNDRGAQRNGVFLKNMKINASCTCHRCVDEGNICLPGMDGWKLNNSMMILCPTCGNKRCPHASDHRLECTGSNEPGQKGSVYE